MVLYLILNEYVRVGNRVPPGIFIDQFNNYSGNKYYFEKKIVGIKIKAFIS
jgi:hypothetical protein